jgi:hypothetical protein
LSTDFGLGQFVERRTTRGAASNGVSLEIFIASLGWNPTRRRLEDLIGDTGYEEPLSSHMGYYTVL